MTISPPLATGTIHAFALADGGCYSARDSGLWHSADGGATWRHATGGDTPDQAEMVTCIGFALGGTPGNAAFAGSLGAVLRSGDGGHTWRPAALPPPAPLITCLAVSPGYDEDGVVLAGTLEDGILRSDDRGERWRRWNFGLLDLSVYALAVSPGFALDDTLFAGTETTLFRSENGGRSWRETALPYGLGPVLALALDDRGTLWAGTEQHGIWHSPDRGETWRHDEGTAGEPVNALIPAGGAMLAVLPDAILRRPATSASWQLIFTGPGAGDGIAGVAVTDAPPPWLASTGAAGGDPTGSGPAPSPGARERIYALVHLRDGSIRPIRIIEQGERQ